MVLVCVMVLALVPVTTLTVSAAATGTTALFNGNATYLLQERFNLPSSFSGDATRVLSGWDINYRGGDVTVDGGAMLTDSNAYESTSISHQLMKHSGGGLVMESVFEFTTTVDEGFYYEMSGEGSVALRLETVRQTVGGANCLFAVNGTNTSIVAKKDTEYHLRAEFTGSTVTVWLNGEKIANAVAYLEAASLIDNIKIGTSETGIGKIRIKNAYVYVNYTVNESFLGKDVSDWWLAANGDVTTVPGAPYTADTYGFALNPTEAVEPAYIKDDASVRIVADEADEFTWVGGSAVTVTDNQTAGGRSGVVMATGLGNGNATTLGVVLGDNFAFQEGDVLTYSFDVYSETAGNANVWVRNHGSSLSPFATLYHSVAANTWTTITKTLTFAELEALISTSGSSGSFTTASKYALYIRPTVSTLYLDNFKVTVINENGEYYSNVATGEWLKMNETMDGPSSNVLWGSNMTSSYADGVLTSTYTTASSNNSIVAVKVVDANGIPVTTIPAGSVIDVSVDVHSSVALSTSASSTQGIMLRGGSMTNGGSGPSSTNIYQLGLLTAAANTWTTQKASYTAASDLTVSGAWYVFLRPQQAGTLKVDNFKISIRNPEAAVIAPTWEINTASDVTYKNGGTATDANGIGGRDGVVMLGNLANANGNTAGIVLGTSFAFKEGDILKYSFDAYSTSAIEPDLWLRNHGSSLNPFKQIDIASIPASTWTTRSGEIDYATLIAEGAFNTADKYCLYFRPNASGTIYIDNFKVEVFNSNEHIVDLVDGSRFKATANSVSDLTHGASNASDSGTAGVITANLQNNNTNVIGFTLGKTFTFKENDVLEYSFDIYSDTSIIPDVWIRDGSTSTFKTLYQDATTAGTWTTVSGKATYAELIAAAAGFANAATSTNGYAVFIRPRSTATVQVKNFTVKVTQEAYAFGELPSNASLEKRFSALSGAQALTFDVFVPSTGADGFSAKLGGATFKIAGGMFYVGSTALTEVTNNVWYRIKLVVDGSTASLYVNGALKGSASVSGDITSVAFENTASTQILIDNVQVAPKFDPATLAGYPELSDSDIATPATQSSQQLSIGMVSYPMWREGIHYGWDLISPYEHEREPYLGYYTGGSPEVADWNLKWWAEHGFDHVIYPFVRPAINEAGGQPSFSVRGEELHDGYMNARYNNKVDFAIMLTNPLEEQFTDASGNVTNAEEWIANVLPYLTEQYFKHPNYKVVDNQLVVYNYDLDGFQKVLTVEDESGNVTQDGVTEVVEILSAINAKAKTLGYAGVMFIMDTTSMKSSELTTLTDAISAASAVNTLYKWKYTWRTDVGNNVAEGITTEYGNSNDVVASIPMGFESTPWVPSEIGYIPASDIETICNTVMSSRDSSDPKIVLFTCWDEWGEGHYYSPSANSGFDYLNAVRKTLTTAGAALSSEDTPIESAKKRMGVLYPEGRQMLKIREDKKETLDPALFTTELGTLTPSRSNYVDRAGCDYQGSFFNRDYTTYDVTDPSQAAVWFDAPSGIDFSKVTAIKFVGYAQNSASLVVKFGTSSLDDSFGDDTGDNRFRFSCTNTDPINATSAEYILTPNNPGKIAEAASASIDLIRFNTQQSTSGGEFHIEKIVFYSDPVPNQGSTVTVDEVPFTMVSTSVEAGGTTLLPAYRFLIDAGAEVTWDKSLQKLYATMNGVTAVYQAGLRNVVDAETGTVIYATAASGAGAVYNEGNLFVDYNVLLAPFGYTVEVDDSGAINYYSPDFFKTYDETDYVWEFERDGDTEGWTLSEGSTNPITYLQGGNAITVKDGVMHYRASSTDTHMAIEGLSMPKTTAKDFAMKLDTNATKMLLRLYDAGTYNTAGGLVYVVNVPEIDGTQEIVLDLSTATPRDSGASWDTLADTITKVRIDAVYGNTGSNYIDYIQFGDPIPFRFKAFSFGENLFDATEAYWVYSGVYDKNGTTTGGWGITPTVVTDGEYTDVLELKPTDGVNNGFAGITWLHSGTGVGELETYVTGKQVRVSFDYKAQGDAYQFRFENRDTVNGRDGEEFTVAATNEWQHFDGYLNMDEVEGTGRRTYAIRVFRNSTSGDGAILIKDWQIRILDEENEVTMFTDSGVGIKVINYNDVTSTTKVFVSAFDTVNKELNGFASGSIPNTVTVSSGNTTTKTETYPYYYMAPTDATTEIRTYVWDVLDPLIDAFVLPRAE